MRERGCEHVSGSRAGVSVVNGIRLSIGGTSSAAYAARSRALCRPGDVLIQYSPQLQVMCC